MTATTTCRTLQGLWLLKGNQIATAVLKWKAIIAPKAAFGAFWAYHYSYRFTKRWANLEFGSNSAFEVVKLIEAFDLEYQLGCCQSYPLG